MVSFLSEDAELKLFSPGLPFIDDPSFPPATFIPSSVATTLISPPFIVISELSIPS
ncbi:hypothetical protein D3C75_1215880 [compost metagenome]